MRPGALRAATAENWVAVKALAVLAGDSARAAADITAEADAAGLSGSRRSGADACVRCLNDRQECLWDQSPNLRKIIKQAIRKNALIEGKVHDSMDALLADLDFEDADWPAGPLALSSLGDSLVSNSHGKKSRAARHFDW